MRLQCLRNITTNEMENAWRFEYMMREKKAAVKDDEAGVTDLTTKEFFNPFDRGLALNCIETFCRPGVQLLARSGQVTGADGLVRTCPGAGFPDYFNITSVDDLEQHKMPSYREMLALSASKMRYDSVKTEDDQV